MFQDLVYPPSLLQLALIEKRLLMLVYAYDLLLPLPVHELPVAALVVEAVEPVLDVVAVILHTYYDPPKIVVPVDSGVSKPLGLVAIVDFDPARFLALFSA